MPRGTKRHPRECIRTTIQSKSERLTGYWQAPEPYTYWDMSEVQVHAHTIRSSAPGQRFSGAQVVISSLPLYCTLFSCLMSNKSCSVGMTTPKLNCEELNLLEILLATGTHWNLSECHRRGGFVPIDGDLEISHPPASVRPLQVS